MNMPLAAGPTSPAPEGESRMGEYLSPIALAGLLDVPVDTIRGWRKRGILPPPIKLGKLIRWPRKGIDEWLKGRQETDTKGRSGTLQWQGQALQRVGGK